MNFEDYDPDLRGMFIELHFKCKILRVMKGTLGLVYIVQHEHSDSKFAIKTIDPQKLTQLPRIEAITRFKRELTQWYTYRHHPFILAPFFVKIINNWPFIAMSFREKSVRGYIDESFETQSISLVENLNIAIQVCHGLIFAKTKGLIAHQDLKPDNILLQDLREHFAIPPHYPLNWRVSIADFGLANAYKEIGKPSGSRPYMAPEQYSATTDFSKVDLFALGAIFTELFSGYHPVGLQTPNVWPDPQPGFSRAWIREDKWKKWARKNDEKINQDINLPEKTRELFERMLVSDASRRPELQEVESELRSMLRNHNESAFNSLEVILQEWDRLAQKSEQIDKASPEQYEETQMNKFGLIDT